MIPLVVLSEKAYAKGYADGLAKTLTRADIMADKIGWTGSGYPHHLARCYLQGHTDGGLQRIHDTRKASA